MYEYTYDTESGGILLDDRPTGMSKEPRPVYSEELDLLGVDRFYQYDKQNDVPYMWAEAHRYYYRGINIFNTKGGTLYEKPEIVLVRTKETDSPILAEGTELLPIDVELMNRKNHDLIEVVEQITVRKIWNIYKKYKSKVDRFHVALSGGKDSIVLLELVRRTLPKSAYTVIFGDTKMEFPDTYDVIDKIEAQCKDEGIEFYRASSHFDPEESWKLFGPPSRVLRWCCTVHKSTPQTLKLREITGKNDYVGLDFVGVRKHESAMRSKYEEENYGKKQKGQYSHNPILEWTSAEIWLYIFAHHLIVNAAYKKGNSRAGCLFCPMGRGKADSFRYMCYHEEIDKYTQLIKSTINDPHIESYITNGGWAERKNGRDIIDNIPHYSEMIKDGYLFITIINPNTDWKEWIKTLANISFPYTVENINDGYVIKVPENVNKTTECKYFKQVFHKAAYCAECKACEANCKYGCLSFKNGLHIDNCKHCMQCHNIDSGCLLFHSRQLPLNGGKTMKKNSINSFSDHAPKPEWVRDFFLNGNDFMNDNTLGPMQIQKFRVFLNDSGVTFKNETTELFTTLSSFGIDNAITWGIMLINLVYNNTEMRWFIDNMKIGETFKKEELENKLVEEYSLSPKDASSVRKTFKKLVDIPLGTVLHFGEYTVISRNEENLTRTKCTLTDPRVLLYALYRYAEENGGYYSFSMTTLLDMTINSVGISPVRIFGITRDELEPMLRGLSSQYQDYINVAITLDLDNIVLSDYHTSGDILKLLEV